MKRCVVLMLLAIGCGASAGAEIRIVSLKGYVYARHNVQEEWVGVAAGDVLKPEDSMKLEKKSSATILIDGVRKIVVPESVILDLSDLRTLTQEELLLKLAMEDVRGIPNQPTGQPGDIHIPTTTTIHGENKTPSTMPEPNPAQTGALQLNGARLLFDQGFYATCVLKTKGIVRRYPDLSNVMDAHVMIADGLERMKLKGEALREYLNIPGSSLTAEQRSIVEGKIARLKAKNP